MKEALLALLASKKAWTAAFGVLTLVAAKAGFDVDANLFWGIAGLFGILLGAQGLTDHGKEASKSGAPQ